MSRVRSFFRRHPILRETLLWAVPALLVGSALRAMMLSYLPYGFFGPDAKSYFNFAHELMDHRRFELDEKRRYLYPLLMFPVAALPGAPLRWLAILQHLLGLVSVLPMAYVVRKSFRFWRWWIIPVTTAYVSLPFFLWYEHELLGEALFFSMLLWAFGGWVAWATQKDPARARRLFWYFFSPFAAFLMTKPSGRFLVPGIVCGLLMMRAWRVLAWRHWAALVALFAAALTVGAKWQAAWLLYVATFPLTQLDTPAHAEYKSELRPFLEPYARDIDKYYRVLERRDREGVSPFYFLKKPSEENAPPLWAALDRDESKKNELYMSLAIEGITARPRDFFYLGLQRLVASAGFSQFDYTRFASARDVELQREPYKEAQTTMGRGKVSGLPRAFGLPTYAPLPPYEAFSARLIPTPGCWAERTLLAWAAWLGPHMDLVTLPVPREDAPRAAWSISHARLTVLGWWVVGSLLISFAHWRTLGVWTLAILAYLVGVFLVSLVNPRYFAPAWLALLPLSAAPLDALCSLLCGRRKVA